MELIEDHFVVFGWDSFGKQVVDMIIKNSRKVVVVTEDMNAVNHLNKTMMIAQCLFYIHLTVAMII